MKTIHALLIILAATTLMNCEKQLYVETGVLWSDDNYFSTEGQWYVAISEGCYSNEACAIINVLDQQPLSPGTNATCKFMVGGGSEGNITAFVYLDVNENGIYDDGYDKLTGYKYNYADDTETTNITVFAYF